RVLSRPRLLIDPLLAADGPGVGIVDAAVKDLACAGRHVAVGFEVLRNRNEIGVDIAKIRPVVEDAGRIRMLAVPEARARRIAERELAVRPIELHAPLRQPVKVRRVDDLIAVTAELRTQVIEGDHEDIELRAVRGGRWRQVRTSQRGDYETG